ncbi:MAG: lasso peptide biosynthesis B2 protein [Pseudonocardiales bacterium]
MIVRLARWLLHTASQPVDATEIEVMLAAIDRAGRWLPARVACLERSFAVVLWCGLRRRSVCWRIGVRTPPFTAHSWIEVAGQAVGERTPVHSYQPILTIGHAEREGL